MDPLRLDRSCGVHLDWMDLMVHLDWMGVVGSI